MARNSLRILTLAIVSCALLVASAPSPAAAATIHPTRFDDPVPDGCLPDDCSLREAIVAANESQGIDIIELSAGVYTLSIEGRDEDASLTGDLDASSPVYLVGLSAASTVIDAGGIDRALHIVPPPGLHPTVGLNALTVRNGQACVAAAPDSGDGGAVYAPEGIALDISDVTFEDNTAEGNGGAIFSRGKYLGINRSLLRGNHATNGGAVYSAGESHTFYSTFTGNVASVDGGAFDAVEGLLDVLGSTVEGNSASRGGGIATGAATLRLQQVTLANNAASQHGGGLALGGQSEVVGSAIEANTASLDGGGVLIDAGSLGIGYSTLSGNTAGRGGAILSLGGLTAENVTISGNAATGIAGGVFADRGSTLLRYVTLADNTSQVGTGVNLANDGANVAVEASIVSGSPNNCGGAIESMGHNIDSGTSCGFSVAGDRTATNAMLAPLADSFAIEHAGLHTRTRALLPGSPAIDAGPDQACPVFDQRGARRPQDGTDDRRAFCDAGAFELAGVACFVVGDVDRDGRITSIDALLILQRHAGLIDAVPCVADFNWDGRIDSIDAQRVLRAVLLSKPDLPAPQI